MQYNLEETRKKFINHEEVKFTFQHFGEKDTLPLELVVGVLLRSVEADFLHEVAFMIINELVVNACKANAKRVFFEMRKKNIHSKTEYLETIGGFKSEFGHISPEFEKRIQKSKYVTNLILLNKEDHVLIKVTNNCTILPEEEERLVNRINASASVANLSDAYTQFSNSEEGSGLGIVLVHILLKNCGISHRAFHLQTEEGLTTISLELPKEIFSLDLKLSIYSTLERKVEGIPSLPDSIISLLGLIRDPSTSFEVISEKISQNPALALEVLRLSNSVVYGKVKQIFNIKEAISVIGMKTLETIVLEVGLRKLLVDTFPKFRDSWNHSLKASFFARSLAMQWKKTKSVDLAAIGALLHNLGQMILLSLDSQWIDSLLYEQKENQFQKDFFEEVAFQKSHRDIAAILVNKWNLPKEIHHIILFYHRPWDAPPHLKEVCEIVAMSHSIAKFDPDKTHLPMLEYEVLQNYNIKNMNDLAKASKELEEEFANFLK